MSPATDVTMSALPAGGWSRTTSDAPPSTIVCPETNDFAPARVAISWPAPPTVACWPEPASVRNTFEPVTAHAPTGNNNSTANVMMIAVSWAPENGPSRPARVAGEDSCCGIEECSGSEPNDLSPRQLIYGFAG